MNTPQFKDAKGDNIDVIPKHNPEPKLKGAFNRPNKVKNQRRKNKQARKSRKQKR